MLRQAAEQPEHNRFGKPAALFDIVYIECILTSCGFVAELPRRVQHRPVFVGEYLCGKLLAVRRLPF